MMTLRIEPLDVEVLAFSVNANIADASIDYFARFVVNGRTCEVKMSLDEFRNLSGSDTDFVVNHVVPQLSRAIVEQVLRKNPRALLR